MVERIWGKFKWEGEQSGSRKMSSRRKWAVWNGSTRSHTDKYKYEYKYKYKILWVVSSLYVPPSVLIRTSGISQPSWIRSSSCCIRKELAGLDVLQTGKMLIFCWIHPNFPVFVVNMKEGKGASEDSQSPCFVPRHATVPGQGHHHQLPRQLRHQQQQQQQQRQCWWNEHRCTCQFQQRHRCQWKFIF